jgi:hypothetical protein
VCTSRNFFLEGAVAEIWSEFSFGSFLCGIQHECSFLFSFSFFALICATMDMVAGETEWIVLQQRVGIPLV